MSSNDFAVVGDDLAFNMTHISDSYDYYYNGTYQVECPMHPSLQYSIGFCISFLGVLTNLTFIYVVAQVQAMRTILNVYLVNLAVVDLMHLCWHCTMWVGFFIADYNSFTDTEYCAMLFFNRLYQYVSLFAISAISIERYLAICKPVIYRDSIIHKSRFVAFVIFLIWCAGSLFATEAVLDCVSPDFGRALVGRIVFLFVVFSIMVVVLTMYVLIIMVARNSSRPVLARRKERQILRVCLATALIHYVCLIPMLFQTGVFIAEFDYKETSNAYHLQLYCLGNIATFFLETNSAVNPLIYNVLSSTYRLAFKNAFCFGNRRRSHEASSLRQQISTRTMSSRTPAAASTAAASQNCHPSKDVYSM